MALLINLFSSKQVLASGMKSAFINYIEIMMMKLSILSFKNPQNRSKKKAPTARGEEVN